MQTRKHFTQEEAAKHPSPSAKNSWCVQFPVGKGSNTTAKARLIVFCHAGGNSASYRAWDALLSPEISLVIVELPGRLTRFKDPLISDVPTIVKQSVEQGLVSFLDKPFFLFGHSFGSVVAFEVARYLQSNFNISPLCLFISSHLSPTKPPGKLHKSSDQDLINYLIVTYKDKQLEKVKREYPELLQMVTPAIRADVTAGETYIYAPTPVLQCPLMFFYGEDEPQITIEDVQGWKAQTELQEKFEEKKFPGGHFYLQDAANFIQVLNAYLQKFL